MSSSARPDISHQRDISFRSDEISYILSRIKAGDSCSIVGVGSVGKTNLLRHLLQKKTQTYHLGDEAQDITLVLVDPNTMLDPLPLRGASDAGSEGLRSSWAGYEVMAHRLYRAFYPFEGLGADDIKKIGYLYDQFRDGNNPLIAHLGLRYLEHMLELLFSVPAPSGKMRKIAIIFDEFEEMLANLPVRFFQTLRGLRDVYKYHLTYLTFTRRALPHIIEELEYDRPGLESFVELFTDGTLYLGPYSESDARAMLERLAERKEIHHPKSFRDFLLRASGGHAGLLRASFSLATKIAVNTRERDAMRFLVNSSAIQDECLTIWDSLTRDERLLLKQLRDHPELLEEKEDVVALLKEKKLLAANDNGALEIAPPLFREYVLRFAEL